MKKYSRCYKPSNLKESVKSYTLSCSNQTQFQDIIFYERILAFFLYSFDMIQSIGKLNNGMSTKKVNVETLWNGPIPNIFY